MCCFVPLVLSQKIKLYHFCLICFCLMCCFVSLILSCSLVTKTTLFVMLIYNVLFRFFNAFESFVTKITLLTFVVWLLMLVSHVPFHFFTTFKLSVTNITISGITLTIAVVSKIASKLRFARKICYILKFSKPSYKPAFRKNAPIHTYIQTNDLHSRLGQHFA